MTLLELYEDLFQYVCRLKRTTGGSVQLEYNRVRAEVQDQLEKIQKSAAASDARLARQVQALELPIIFFLDNVISTAGLQCSAQWSQTENRLAFAKSEMGGDEKFFDCVSDDLNDRSEEASERLAVYYTCFGLGFTGMYVNNPDKIREYMERIFPEIRRWMDADPKSKVTSDAYQHTNRTVLTEPPNHKLIVISILFVILSVAVLGGYYGFYAKALEELDSHLAAILQHQTAPASAKP
jgi:type VI secretion system protein ImpK